MGLFAKPAFVAYAEPLPRHFIRNKCPLGKVRVILGEEPSGITFAQPKKNEPGDNQENIAVSPAEAFIGANATTLSATIRPIVDLCVTRRTFHS